MLTIYPAAIFDIPFCIIYILGFISLYSGESPNFKRNIFGHLQSFHSLRPDFEINISLVALYTFQLTQWVSMIFSLCLSLQPFQSFIHSR